MRSRNSEEIPCLGVLRPTGRHLHRSHRATAAGRRCGPDQKPLAAGSLQAQSQDPSRAAGLRKHRQKRRRRCRGSRQTLAGCGRRGPPLSSCSWQTRANRFNPGIEIEAGGKPRGKGFSLIAHVDPCFNNFVNNLSLGCPFNLSLYFRGECRPG